VPARYTTPMDTTTRTAAADNGMQFHAPHMMWRAFPVLGVAFYALIAHAAYVVPTATLIIHFGKP